MVFSRLLSIFLSLVPVWYYINPISEFIGLSSILILIAAGLFGLIFPRFVYQIYEMLIYWAATIYIVKYKLNIEQLKIVFCLGLIISTIANSTGLLKRVINLFKFILFSVTQLIIKLIRRKREI